MKNAFRKFDGTQRVWSALANLSRLTGFAVAVALLTFLVHYLTDPASFPVGKVEVEGQLRRVNRAALMERLGPLMSPGFLQIDVNALVRSAGSLDWVDRVEAQRIWPDRLVLRVTEQVPVARWNRTGLMNARGEVFTDIKPGEIFGLPSLVGPDQDRELVFARYLEFQELLAGLGEIARLELEHQATWRIDFTNSAVVYLRNQDARSVLTRFLEAWPGLRDERRREFARLDLRYEHGFALLWKEPEAVPDEQG